MINVSKFTEDVKEEEKSYIDKVCDQTPKHDTLIMLGDFNARNEEESSLRDVAGKFTAQKNVITMDKCSVD